MTYPLVTAAAVLFAALDRLWGSDVKIKGRSGHSLGTVGALLAAGACWFALRDPYAAAVCAVWPLYRSLNNSGGAMAPENLTQALAAFGRHAIAAGLVCGILALEYQGLTPLMFYPISYVFIATGLAVFNGATEGKANWAVETARGAAFGATAALALGFA